MMNMAFWVYVDECSPIHRLFVLSSLSTVSICVSNSWDHQTGSCVVSWVYNAGLEHIVHRKKTRCPSSVAVLEGYSSLASSFLSVYARTCVFVSMGYTVSVSLFDSTCVCVCVRVRLSRHVCLYFLVGRDECVCVRVWDAARMCMINIQYLSACLEVLAEVREIDSSSLGDGGWKATTRLWAPRHLIPGITNSIRPTSLHQS